MAFRVASFPRKMGDVREAIRTTDAGIGVKVGGGGRTGMAVPSVGGGELGAVVAGPEVGPAIGVRVGGLAVAVPMCKKAACTLRSRSTTMVVVGDVPDASPSQATNKECARWSRTVSFTRVPAGYRPSGPGSGSSSAVQNPPGLGVIVILNRAAIVARTAVSMVALMSGVGSAGDVGVSRCAVTVGSAV